MLSEIQEVISYDELNQAVLYLGHCANKASWGDVSDQKKLLHNFTVCISAVLLLSRAACGHGMPSGVQ